MAAAPASAPPRSKKLPKHLAEIYDVEALLGQGAFSKVWRCRHRNTGQVRALKKIDTTELHPRDIALEIALMKLLRHDSVVKCYEVFLEAQFVSIVIDIFTGGDLIDGLNVHRRVKGRIADAQLAQIVRQMVAAVVHVHSLRIVHRDIKGENFLLDRPDIGDPDCCVALADFGTAIRIEPGGKLHDRVGTPAFWAPEVWGGCYDFLVDVWAVGVTTFILLAGSLPFEGEAQICKPQVEGEPVAALPYITSRPCADFIHACLTKEPGNRPQAIVAAQHPWMMTQRPAAASSQRSDQLEAASSAVGVAIDAVGAIAMGCCSGFGLCLEILLGDGEATKPQQGAGGGAASSSKQPAAVAGGGVAELPLGHKAIAAAAEAAAPGAASDDIEKEVTELTHNLEKLCSSGPPGSAKQAKQACQPKLPDRELRDAGCRPQRRSCPVFPAPR